jgi:hypothetical protein
MGPNSFEPIQTDPKADPAFSKMDADHVSWVKSLVHGVDHAPFSNLSAYLSYEKAGFFFYFYRYIFYICMYVCTFPDTQVWTYIYINFCTWGYNVALFLK